jgi:hypothetical protein
MMMMITQESGFLKNVLSSQSHIVIKYDLKYGRNNTRYILADIFLYLGSSDNIDNNYSLNDY